MQQGQAWIWKFLRKKLFKKKVNSNGPLTPSAGTGNIGYNLTGLQTACALNLELEPKVLFMATVIVV